MKKQVFLTGAFGNVGQNTLKQLIKRGHEVTCFDLRTPANEKSNDILSKKIDFKTIWGDITNKKDVFNALNGFDCIIHLAAIIPPLSENNPELARKVNVEGTRNLLNAANKLPDKPKFIMASSASVFGVTMDLNPPITVNTPLNPSDTYSHTKVECEKMLRESGLPWMILRLGAVSVDKLPSVENASILFEMPLEQRIHFVSSRDCGIAFANAINLGEDDKIYLIGGGEGSQLLEKDFMKELLSALGLKMSLPEGAFKQPKKKEDWFYIDWMDTKESQEALEFQTEPFQEYIKRLKKSFRLRRFGMKLIAPIAKIFLLKKSPYYKS